MMINQSYHIDTKPNSKHKYEKSQTAWTLNDSFQAKTYSLSVLEGNEYIQESTLLTELPNEILGSVFEYVSFADLFRLEQVNKHLQNVVLRVVWPRKHTLRWDSINQYVDQSRVFANNKPRKIAPKVKTKFLIAVFDRTNIKHLDLSALYLLTEQQKISHIFSAVPQLLSLNLSFITLHKIDLLIIAKYCPLLEELSLEDSFYWGGDTTERCEEGLKHIFIRCKNMKYLNLSGNTHLEGNISFGHIPTGLRYLNITDCFQITPNSLELVASRAKNLETLVFSCFTMSGDANDILKMFPKLKKLELNCIYGDLIDFSRLKELEMLCLEFDTDEIDVESLKSLTKCRKLKSLDITFDCECELETNVFEILANCKSLEYCHFGGCNNLNQLIDFVQDCQIKYLSITNCGVVTEEIINSLLIECISLTHLELTKMWRLNYKAIQERLKEENPHRRNILKFVIQKPPFELQSCRWCEVIPIEQNARRVFGYFTDVKDHYHNVKPIN